MSRARDLSKLSNPAAFNIDSNNNIGIGSTTPDAKLDVVGVVSATQFYGDGSNLSGITSGATLSAGSGSQRVVVTSLTSGTMTTAATDAELTYNSSTNTLTATAFSGDLTGDVTGNADTATTASNAQGLTGTPDITVRNIIGVAATFTGVLTYEDVTNVDSIGIVTARTGIAVLGAGITATGIGTFHSGLNTEDILAEEVNVTAGKLSDNTNIDVENGMVHLFTTTETTTSTPNIRYNASTSLNSRMSIGQSIVVTLITTAAAAAYSANITIDSNPVTENWIGGSAPDAGGSSGVDIHSFTIIKTADATFTVIGNHSKTS